MSKLRRQHAKVVTALEVELSEGRLTLERARDAWRSLNAQNRTLREERRDAQLAAVRERRGDLARVANLHQRVMRRAAGRGRAERFYCDTCNTLWPCRTIEVLSKLNGHLDDLFLAAKAS